MAFINISLESSVKNDSGVVFKGGSVSSSSPAQAFASQYSPDSLPFASYVVQGVNTTTALSDEGSVFAYNTNTPLIKGETVVINSQSLNHELYTTGTANPSLINSIHPVFGARTRLAASAIRNGYFDIYTGKFDLGWPDVQYDAFGDDVAATPSRSNPGTMYYSLGKKYVAKNYQAKTWEIMIL